MASLYILPAMAGAVVLGAVVEFIYCGKRCKLARCESVVRVNAAHVIPP